MSARLYYPIKEMFVTLQGEGAHAGSRAVFCRVTGCNVWSGREQDRARDVAKGTCAAWCDTDFRGTDGVNGGKYTADDLATKARALWGSAVQDEAMLVVVTGGEPSLVLDEAFVRALHTVRARVHVETNGSNLLPRVDWVTLSPKPPMPVVAQRYDEVKVVFPADVNPLMYAEHARTRFIQPLDAKDPEINARHTASCIAFIHEHPSWRLSTQLHKVWGLP